MKKKNVVIITGASSGIGKASAKLIRGDGNIVYVGARRIEEMNDLKKLGCYVQFLDVTDDKSCQTFVNKVIKKEKQIDVLINNAGYGVLGSVEETPIKNIENIYNVNVLGYIRMAKLVIPHMRKQKSGKIINVSSIVSKFGYPFGSWYVGTKYAVDGMSECWNLELSPLGIKTILVNPGGIKTEFRGSIKYITSKINIYNQIRKRSEKTFSGHEKYPDAGVIAKIMQKIIIKNNPKPRYYGGAKTFLVKIKNIIGERLFLYIFKNITK